MSRFRFFVSSSSPCKWLNYIAIIVIIGGLCCSFHSAPHLGVMANDIVDANATRASSVSKQITGDAAKNKLTESLAASISAEIASTPPDSTTTTTTTIPPMIMGEKVVGKDKKEDAAKNDEDEEESDDDDKDEKDEDDDEDDDNDGDDKMTKSKMTDKKKQDVGNSGKNKKDKDKEEDDEEDDDEEEDDADGEEEEEEEEECDNRLSTFVRSFDGSKFLPDDFEQLSEFMHLHGPYGHVAHINGTLEILQRAINYGEKLRQNKDLTDTVMYLSSVIMDKMYEAKISTQCMADAMGIVNAIRDGQSWPIKFPDSFGTLFLGLLHAQHSSFGEYDQCLGIKSPPTDSGRHIYGKYCTLHISAITPPIESYDPSYERLFREHPLFARMMQLVAAERMDNYVHRDFAKFITQATDRVDDNIYHQGICVPHSCSSDDLQRLINELWYPLVKIPVRIPEKLCSTRAPEALVQASVASLDAYQRISIIVLSVITFVVTTCTVVQFVIEIRNNNNNKNNNFLATNVTAAKDSSNNNNNDDDEKNLKQKAKIVAQKHQQEKEIIINEEKNDQKVDSKAQLQINSRRSSLGVRIMLSFSAIENTRRLFAIGDQKRTKRLAPLDSLRALFTLLIFPVNSYGLTLLHYPALYRNTDGMTRMEMLHSNGHWTTQIPGLWFDGFVFIFGVLTTVTQFDRLKRSLGEFSYFTFVGRKWYRMSAVLGGTILLIYLFPLIGDGPMWFYQEQYFVAPCRRAENLLSTFFYYSNWNEMLDDYAIRSTLPICNPPTWFTSSFFQLNLLAPLLFLPLYFWPAFGVAISAATILLGVAFAILPRIIFDIPSYIEVTKFADYAANQRAIVHSHMSPLMYVTALAAGILTGFAIKRKPRLPLGGPIMETIIEIASFASICAIFVWHRSFTATQNVIQPIEQIVSWFAYYKLTWSLFLSFVTFVACTGRSGTLGRLLGAIPAAVRQPLAKLSFCIYIIRSLTIFYRHTTVRHAYEMYYFESFQNIFFDFLLTTGLAYVLHLLFEAPTLALARQLSRSDRVDDAEDEEDHHTTDYGILRIDPSLDYHSYHPHPHYPHCDNNGEKSKHRPELSLSANLSSSAPKICE